MELETRMMVVSMSVWIAVLLLGVLIGPENPIGFLMIVIGGLICLMGLTLFVAHSLKWLKEAVFGPSEW